MDIVILVSQLMGLTVLILKEFFSARARARERNEKFEVSKTLFLKFVDDSIVNLREEAKRENRDVGDVEDRVDRDKF